MPTLALSTLAGCMDKVNKLHFKYETDIKPSIGKVV